MFDLISGGPRRPHGGAAAPVVVSIVGHVVVLTLVLVLPLLYATDAIPSVPTMMAFVAEAEAPAPPPPPPPPAPKPSVAKPVTTRPAPTPSSTFAAPVEAPAEVRPEPSGLVVVDEGDEGGVEGGIEGGVAGGIVGGLVTAPAPPPPPAQPKAPVRIGGAIQAPALIKRVEPIYPDVALMAKVSGIVILEAVVDADGSVKSVRVLRSVKFFDEAAVEALKQWKYSPLVLNGDRTPFVLSVTLNFRIQ